MESRYQDPENQDQSSVELNPMLYEVTSAPPISPITKKIKNNVFIMIICVLFLFLFARPGNNISFIVGISFLGFVLMVIDFILNLILYLRVKRLDAKGVLTTVILNDCYTYNRYMLDSDDHMQSLKVFILEYHLPEGFRIKNSVPQYIFEMVNQGDPVNVRYLPNSPSLQRVELNK